MANLGRPLSPEPCTNEVGWDMRPANGVKTASTSPPPFFPECSPFGFWMVDQLSEYPPPALTPLACLLRVWLPVAINGRRGPAGIRNHPPVTVCYPGLQSLAGGPQSDTCWSRPYTSVLHPNSGRSGSASHFDISPERPRYRCGKLPENRQFRRGHDAICQECVRVQNAC